MTLRSLAGAVALSLITAGCSDVPTAGPLASQIIDQAGPQGTPATKLTLVELTEQICSALEDRQPQSFRATFGLNQPAPDLTIQVGDVLSVTIWEAGQTSLFSTAATSGPLGQVIPTSHGVALPAIVVNHDGTISIPYGGRLAVVGKEPEQVENLIESALKDKSSELRATVTVAQSASNSVTVSGEVGQGRRLPLDLNGDRVLDAIAGAQSIRVPVSEATVRLTRGKSTVSLRYDEILQNPAENIYLQAGDTLTVAHEPQTFTAFGAVGANSEIPFGTARLTLDEAIARAGGLQDERADPTGVFVFRFEPVEVVSQFAPTAGPRTPAGIPVIYHLDLRQAESYFLARRFAMRDKDMVYVANARLTELQKFLNIVGSVVGPAATAASAGATIAVYSH
ncbi:MAG TPA: polysaccharide biosynthesis/export family protein [Rhizomicrobium sp.]